MLDKSTEAESWRFPHVLSPNVTWGNEKIGVCVNLIHPSNACLNNSERGLVSVSHGTYE